MTEKKENETAQADFAMPEITFSTFILSLNSSVLVHLGMETDPISGNKSMNLLLAKQTIDILSLFEEKTKGNLTDDEKRLLTHILYELRLMYVKQQNKK